MKTREMVILIQSLSVDEATKELTAFLKGKSKEPLVFPFESEAFAKVWALLVAEPKWKKKTHNALQEALDKIAPYNEDVAIQACKNSISGGYQGIFPESVKLEKSLSLPQAKPSILESNKRIFG